MARFDLSISPCSYWFNRRSIRTDIKDERRRIRPLSRHLQQSRCSFRDCTFYESYRTLDATKSSSWWNWSSHIANTLSRRLVTSNSASVQRTSSLSFYGIRASWWVWQFTPGQGICKACRYVVAVALGCGWFCATSWMLKNDGITLFFIASIVNHSSLTPQISYRAI